MHWQFLSSSYKSIQTAITIISAFSISVASVMGSLSTDPKHAHSISFLDNNTLTTPMVVIPNIATSSVQQMLGHSSITTTREYVMIRLSFYKYISNIRWNKI